MKSALSSITRKCVCVWEVMLNKVQILVDQNWHLKRLRKVLR